MIISSEEVDQVVGRVRNVAIGGIGVVMVCALGLAGCGSSAGASPPSSGTANAPSGSSATSSSPTTAGGGTQNASFPSVSALSSFTNYTFTETSGAGTASLTITGRVYDARDYETEVGSTQQYYVNGTAYGVLGTIISKTPASPTDVPPLGGYATQVGDVAHKSLGITVKKLGSCEVANHQGISWAVGTGAVPSAYSQLYQACTDAKTGGLLSLQAGAHIGSAQAEINESFTLTSIGTVGPIAAP